MQKDQLINVSRRRFLVNSATVGAGLTLGIYLPGCGRKQESPAEKVSTPQTTPESASEQEFNAFVRVSPDNKVTVVIKHLEMGQGTYTGLATIVADEMDAAWDQIQVESAPELILGRARHGRQYRHRQLIYANAQSRRQCKIYAGQRGGQKMECAHGTNFRRRRSGATQRFRPSSHIWRIGGFGRQGNGT